jgi:hypothetical protein
MHSARLFAVTLGALSLGGNGPEQVPSSSSGPETALPQSSTGR